MLDPSLENLLLITRATARQSYIIIIVITNGHSAVLSLN